MAAPPASRSWLLVLRHPPLLVWNLLSNAVKFAREGGCVTLSVTYDAEGVQIVVEDDGPGIAPAFLPHVRGVPSEDSSTTRRYSGLGLGLAIAKQLVNMPGGSIAAGNRE